MPTPELIKGDVVTRGTSEAWATYSTCEKYRYVLGRCWDIGAPMLTVCLLNPSTATEDVLDPTLRRVQGFAKRENLGGFLVVNVFAYRSTDRKALLKVDDPVGPLNDEAIFEAAVRPRVRVVAGWGCPDSREIEERMARVKHSLWSVRVIMTFGELTKHGHPRHPLYLAKTTPIVPWNGAD